jgi:hypothetical protein
MKFFAWLLLLAAALPLLRTGVSPKTQAQTTPKLTLIDFDAVLAPHGITNTTCWGGMGFDHHHNPAHVTRSFTPVRMEADPIASRVLLDAPPIALSCMTASVRYAISPSA